MTRHTMNGYQHMLTGTLELLIRTGLIIVSCDSRRETLAVGQRRSLTYDGDLLIEIDE